jgi:peptide/nickel transport system substrate-binding protein
VDIRFGSSGVGRGDQVLSGQADVDVATVQSTNAQTQINTDPELSRRVHQIPVEGLSVNLLAVIPGVAPLDNEHCRRAVAWALDRPLIRRSGVLGDGPIATAVLPPRIADLGEPAQFPSPEDRGNVDQARAELRQCGQPNGFAVTLGNSVTSTAATDAISESLNRIGVKTTVKPTFDELSRAAASGFGLVLTQAVADWPAPYGYYAGLVDQRSALADQADIQRIFRNGLTASSDEARLNNWHALDEALQQRGFYVPLVVVRDVLAYNSRLTNVSVSNYLGQLNLTSLGVS